MVLIDSRLYSRLKLSGHFFQRFFSYLPAQQTSCDRISSIRLSISGSDPIMSEPYFRTCCSHRSAWNPTVSQLPGSLPALLRQSYLPLYLRYRGPVRIPLRMLQTLPYRIHTQRKHIAGIVFCLSGQIHQCLQTSNHFTLSEGVLTPGSMFWLASISPCAASVMSTKEDMTAI